MSIEHHAFHGNTRHNIDARKLAYSIGCLVLDLSCGIVRCSRVREVAWMVSLSFVSRRRIGSTRSERKTGRNIDGGITWSSLRCCYCCYSRLKASKRIFSPPTYQMHTRLLSSLAPKSEAATKASVCNLLINHRCRDGHKRFDERLSCHVLQLLILGYSAMLTSRTPELQETNACHGKRLLPDGIFGLVTRKLRLPCKRSRRQRMFSTGCEVVRSVSRSDLSS